LYRYQGKPIPSTFTATPSGAKRSLAPSQRAHHVSAEFALGPQRFALERDGRPILRGEGAFPISEDNGFNFNYLSGQAAPV
jgi:hypothetical protein